MLLYVWTNIKKHSHAGIHRLPVSALILLFTFKGFNWFKKQLFNQAA